MHLGIQIAVARTIHPPSIDTAAVARYLVHLTARHGSVGVAFADLLARSWADDVAAPCGVLVELELRILLLVEVLAGVGSFVFEKLDQAVEQCCNDGAEGRAKPVDPVSARETSEDDRGTEGAGGVKGACVGGVSVERFSGIPVNTYLL